MTRHFADRRCPDCGWMFTPGNGGPIRCRPCAKDRRRIKQHENDLRKNPPMPPRARLCICGQAFTAYNAKRCPACRTYRYADVKHNWTDDLVKLSDDPEWRKMSEAEWDALNAEMLGTMREAQAAIDLEKALAEQSANGRQERLSRMLAGIENPFER